MGRQQGKGMQF